MRRLLLVVLTSLGLTVTALTAPTTLASADDERAGTSDSTSASAPEARTVTAALRRTWIRTKFPRRKLKHYARVRIYGHVSGPRRRPVKLQVRTSRGWVNLARTRSSRRHKFSFKAPTWWVARQRIRVFAPRHKRFRGTVSRTRQLNVRRGYRPRGGRNFNYLDTRASRWNPCRVITYRINPKRSGRHGMRDVRRGVRMLSAATGLRFRYRGKTRELPVRRNKVHFRSDMVFAFATARQVRQLRGGVIGIGGFTTGATGAGFGITSGFVVWDSTARLRPGYGRGRATWGKVILHELAHAVGLGHVNDRRLLMYPAVRRWGLSRYGRGDLRGLRQMGLNRGCLPRGGNRVEPKTVMSPVRMGS